MCHAQCFYTDTRMCGTDAAGLFADKPRVEYETKVVISFCNLFWVQMYQ